MTFSLFFHQGLLSVLICQLSRTHFCIFFVVFVTAFSFLLSHFFLNGSKSACLFSHFAIAKLTSGCSWSHWFVRLETVLEFVLVTRKSRCCLFRCSNFSVCSSSIQCQFVSIVFPGLSDWSYRLNRTFPSKLVLCTTTTTAGISVWQFASKRVK